MEVILEVIFEVRIFLSVARKKYSILSVIGRNNEYLEGITSIFVRLEVY